jgi:protein TonB
METVLMAPSWQSKQALKGWGASLMLHACLVLAALGFMPKMAVLVQQEPFTWNVALVEAQPVESTGQEAAPPEQAQPAPPVKPPRQSVRAVQPASQPVQRQVETRVAQQPVQREVPPVVETVKPAPQMQPRQEIVQVQPKQSEPQEIQRSEPVMQAATPAEVKQELAPAIENTVLESTPVAAQSYEAHPVATVPPVVETKPEPVLSASAPVTPSAPMSKQESARAASAPMMEAVSTVGEPSVPTPPALAETVTTAPPPVETAQQDPATMSEHQVVASAVMPKAASKADNKWVADSLMRRVIELRHYPSTAKLNGWEGKVVLKVSIRPDGHLKGVEVVESSGHDTLDQAAIEVVRRACPLHMKEEVTAPLVVMKLPVVYKLSR